MFAKAMILLFFGGAIIASCVGELQLFHLADFIEFYSSLLNCNQADSVLHQQAQLYTDCLSKIQDLPSPPVVKGNEYKDFYRRACLKENAYRKCWEPVIRKSKECNSKNGRGYPTSFSSMITAVCKKDNGRSFTDALAKAAEVSKTEDKEKLCITSGEHWMVQCKDLEIDARDKCKKYSALNKCIEMITCEETAIGRLFLDVYREAGKIDGCISQNSTQSIKSYEKRNHGHPNVRGHRS